MNADVPSVASQFPVHANASDGKGRDIPWMTIQLEAGNTRKGISKNIFTTHFQQ